MWSNCERQDVRGGGAGGRTAAASLLYAEHHTQHCCPRAPMSHVPLNSRTVGDREPASKAATSGASSWLAPFEPPAFQMVTAVPDAAYAMPRRPAHVSFPKHEALLAARHDSFSRPCPAQCPYGTVLTCLQALHTCRITSRQRTAVQCLPRRLREPSNPLRRKQDADLRQDPHRQAR